MKPTNRGVFVMMLGALACLPASNGALEGESAHDEPPAVSRSSPLSEREHVCVVVASELVSLYASLSGKVVNVRRRPGDPVEAGEVLVTLDDASARDRLAVAATAMREASAELAQAKLELARSSRERERVERLFAEGVASRRELDDVSMSAEAAPLRVTRASAALDARDAEVTLARRQVDETVFRSPIRGRVASLSSHSGSTVLAGELLARILSDDAPLVRCALPALGAAGLSVGTSARLHQESGESLPATVQRVAPEVDAISQLVIVELSSPAFVDLLPGTALWMP